MYDAENRMTKAWGGNNQWQEYSYNADGQRTRRKIDGTETWQIYGFDGELLAEYPANAATSSPQKEYGYRNGALLVTAEPQAQSYVLQPLVIGKVLGAQRSDSPGWTGFKMTIGAQPVTVNKLGRQCSAGNSGTHELRLIRVSDNSVVASTNVAMSGCAVGQFKYADLSSPVALSANVAYLLVSYEVGSDLFHDWTDTVLTTTSAVTVNHGVYTTNGGQTWGPAGGTGNSYVPLDLQYQTPASQPLVTGKTLGAQRSDSPGWTGFKMTVGAQPITVSSLGRLCVAAGNTGTHELRLIRVSDNSVVASVNVSMSGCTVGQFKYASLANSISLSGSTAYLLVSYEVGSDAFHDWTGTVLTTTAAATVNHGVYTTNGGQTWGPAGSTGNSYVPVDFQYSTSTAANIDWLVTDQLGTPRMIFDQSGSLTSVTRHDYLPFGEELYAGVGGRTTAQGYSGDAVRQKFTAYERDTETGLDYAQARYFSSGQGRFISADPLMASAKATDPQSWNRYSYVGNSPLVFIDPTGTIAQPGSYSLHNYSGGMAAGMAADGLSPWPEVINEPVNVQQEAASINSATLKTTEGSINGDVDAGNVAFNLTEPQTETIFGGQPFQVNVSVTVPENMSSLTPTTTEEVRTVSNKGLKDALENKKPAQDTQTMTSGSRVMLPENSNFSTTVRRPELRDADKANRPQLESGVTFTQFVTGSMGKISTARFSLVAASDSKTNRNSFTLRIEGKTQRGQTIRFMPIRITINPFRH